MKRNKGILRQSLSLILAMVLLLSLVLVVNGCSKEKKIKNSTIEEAATTFVQALINGDEKTLEKVNRSDAFDFPTHFLMSDVAKKYADMNIKDYKFMADKDNSTVEMIEKATDKTYKVLKIEKIGDKYYFTDFN